MWIGGFVIALGTVLAVFPGRRRNPLDPVSAPAPIESDGPDGPDDVDVPDEPVGTADATLTSDAGDPDEPLVDQDQEVAP